MSSREFVYWHTCDKCDSSESPSSKGSNLSQAEDWIFLYLHSVFLATFMEYIHNIATKEILKYKVVLYNIRKINVNSCRNQSRFACFENFIHKDPFIRSLPSIRSSTTLWRPWGAIMLSYHVLVARSMSQTTLSNWSFTANVDKSFSTSNPRTELWWLFS